jgi:hypothetical protein
MKLSRFVFSRFVLNFLYLNLGPWVFLFFIDMGQGYQVQNHFVVSPKEYFSCV